MCELSLSLLDLGENSFYAGATTVRIHIWEDIHRRLVTLSLQDDGQGMPPDVLANAFTPGFTTRGDGKGLGLSLFSKTVQKSGGQVILLTGRGTFLQGILQLDSPRPPLGNIGGTLALLSERGLTVCYRHVCQDKSISLTLSGLRENLVEALRQTECLARKLAALGSALL